MLVHVLEDDLPAPQSEPALKADIQGPLLFTSEGGEARKITLAGDEAASAPEVISALRQGKKLVRAKLVFEAMEDTYTFTLDAETFDLKSIKLPVPNIADQLQYFDMRIEALTRLYLYVDELFEGFLQLRLDPEQWKEEAATWRKLATGQQRKKVEG